MMSHHMDDSLGIMYPLSNWHIATEQCPFINWTHYTDQYILEYTQSVWITQMEAGIKNGTTYRVRFYIEKKAN